MGVAGASVRAGRLFRESRLVRLPSMTRCPTSPRSSGLDKYKFQVGGYIRDAVAASSPGIDAARKLAPDGVRRLGACRQFTLI